MRLFKPLDISHHWAVLKTKTFKTFSTEWIKNNRIIRQKMILIIFILLPLLRIEIIT